MSNSRRQMTVSYLLEIPEGRRFQEKPGQIMTDLKSLRKNVP